MVSWQDAPSASHSRAHPLASVRFGGRRPDSSTSDSLHNLHHDGGERVLFCNNEAFTNTHTRIWFVPATDKTFGCVFVGFDDGWGQGGLNLKGLAYDWVSGSKYRWERGPGLENARGNPCQRMLESCQTVEEAVAFFGHYWEPSFADARLVVADRTGKSVIFRAEDGKLNVARSQGVGNRFGAHGHEGAEMLSRISKPTIPEAVRLLKFVLQQGPGGTNYSTIYDLKTCDIDLYRFPEQTEPVRFNLSRELKKGPHYYDMPALPEQLSEPLRPLTSDMKKL